MNRKIFIGLSFAAVLAAGTMLTACDQGPKAAAPVKVEQSQKAAAAANSIRFDENAEIENIKHRIELTSSPGALGFILLMNEAGQPIMYTSVKGKITSSGKRLTRDQEIRTFSNGKGGVSPSVINAPSDEGTYGKSDEYIYFWTTEGQYMQWNGKYLYSNQPFRIRVEPLVINTVSPEKK